MSARAERLLNALVFLICVAVLGLARWLEPSPLGHSTHTQLGLDPCAFLSLTGVPCPMCGATTSFSLMAHGRVVDAVVNQPFASGLFVVTLAVAAVAGSEVIRPRGLWKRLDARIQTKELRVAAVLSGALLLGWTYKIWVMATF